MDTEGNNYIREKKEEIRERYNPHNRDEKGWKTKYKKIMGWKYVEKKDLKGKITLEKKENKRRSLGVTSHRARGKKEERGVTASKREENKGKK